MHDQGQCKCRKPLPGMFEQAFRDFPGCHAGNSVIIGDSITDVDAGNRLGMRTILIQSEAAQARLGFQRAATLADAVAASLADAVDRLLLPSAEAAPSSM
jgi:histidinol phosphatase-like enzyme